MNIKIIENDEKIEKFTELGAGDFFSFRQNNEYSEKEDIMLRLDNGYVNLTQLTFYSDEDTSDGVDADTEVIQHQLIEFTIKRG